MSIQSKALLVTFSAGVGTSFKLTDKEASKEVCDNKQAKRDSAEVKKRLIPKKALQDLQDAIDKARDFHEEKTLPWSKAGDILRVDNWVEYTQGMREHRRKVDAAKDAFLALLPKYYAEAQAALGQLYNPADFPSVEKVARGIFFETQFLPLPAGQDFRVDLGEEEVSELRAQVDAQIRATIFTPFVEPLANMVRRLNDPEGVFRNTLVTNLQRLVKLVPPGDPVVDRLTVELEDLTRHDADTLRTVKSIRSETAEKAQAILDKMSGYLPSITGDSDLPPTNIVNLPMPTAAPVALGVPASAGSVPSPVTPPQPVAMSMGTLL